MIIFRVADFCATAIQEFKFDTDAKALAACEVMDFADGVNNCAALICFQRDGRNAESELRKRIGRLHRTCGMGLGLACLLAGGQALGSFEGYNSADQPADENHHGHNRKDDGFGLGGRFCRRRDSQEEFRGLPTMRTIRRHSRSLGAKFNDPATMLAFAREIFDLHHCLARGVQFS